MRIKDALKTATNSLTHSPTRTFLTMLGIVIGIASVILLMSIGSSAQSLIINQVQGIGSNLIFVIPGGSNSSRFSSPQSVQGVIIKTLTQQDVDSLKREPSIAAVVPEVRGGARIQFENNDVNITYEGTTADFFTARNFKTVNGYVFTRADDDSLNRVVVLGSEIAKTLFGQRSAVGKSIHLKGISFRVIGVLEEKGVGAFGIDQDNLVLMPISVAQKQLLGIDYFNAITLQADSNYNVEFVKGRIISVMRQNHRITDPDKDDFTIRTQQDALALLGNITSILTVFLTSIAFISLIVGGIGIMNIMLVSVIERTKEIGLRKALGATDTDILQQFLWESVMLTLLGGIAGIVIGAGLVTGIYFIVKSFFVEGWVFSLPATAIILAVVVSSLTGVVFGLYPARQAARKSPIEALRYE